MASCEKPDYFDGYVKSVQTQIVFDNELLSIVRIVDPEVPLLAIGQRAARFFLGCMSRHQRVKIQALPINLGAFIVYVVTGAVAVEVTNK